MNCSKCIVFLYGYKQALWDILKFLNKGELESIQLLEILQTKELEIDEFLQGRGWNANCGKTE
jgi:hypothetical protein